LEEEQAQGGKAEQQALEGLLQKLQMKMLLTLLSQTRGQPMLLALRRIWRQSVFSCGAAKSEFWHMPKAAALGAAR
jgi:hypothetical protein